VGAIFAIVWKSPGENSHWQRPREVRQQVHKMTNLTADSSSALRTILNPMIALDETRIYAVMHHQRLVHGTQKSLYLHDGGGKSPVVPDHQANTVRLREI